MNFFKKTIKVELGPAGSYTLIDNLHDVPFKNITIWIRPVTSVTYSYSVNYGDSVRTSGSASAGAITTYNDTQILPPNQPSSNWSEGNEYVVGLPVSATFTNTGASNSIFLCSIISETFSQVI